ncbi:hypothetical protein DBV39_05150 [Orrella marina]|uniref:Uncharacterized protein n=1 Tax=Orrella marina TaxID=2163011 RepID=A0A2R4XHA8_9BURK|nr:hypothetical protein DBV39_05150 [Orrella marina]
MRRTLSARAQRQEGVKRTVWPTVWPPVWPYVCFGLASMLFSTLRMDTGARLIKRCATHHPHTTNIVSPMPELWLAIEPGQMLGAQKQQSMAVRPAEIPATSLGL